MIVLLLLLAACTRAENWVLDFLTQDENFKVKNGIDYDYDIKTILQDPHLYYTTNNYNTAQQNYDECRLVCKDIGNLCTGFVFCATNFCGTRRCVLGFNKGLAETYKPDVILQLNHLVQVVGEAHEIQIMGKIRAHEFNAYWENWYQPFLDKSVYGEVYEGNQPSDATSKDYYVVKRMSGDDTDPVEITTPPTFAPIVVPPTDPPSPPPAYPTFAPVIQPTLPPTPKPTPFPTLDYGDIKPAGYIGLGVFSLALLVFIVYVMYIYCYL